MAKSSIGLFSPQIINGVILPSAFVLGGSIFLVPGLLPVAIVICAGLAGYAYYDLVER